MIQLERNNLPTRHCSFTSVESLCQQIRATFYAAALIVITLPLNAVFAQEIPELSGSYGNLIDLDFVEPPEIFALDGAKRGTPIEFTPAVTSADGTDILGATFKAIFGVKKRGFSFDGQYLSIDPDGAGSLDQFRVRGVIWRELQSRVTLAAVGELKSLESIYDQIRITGVASYPVSDRLTVSGNLAWATRDLDIGGTLRDSILGVGVSFGLTSKLKVNVDHEFESKFAKDSYSIALTINNRLVIGAAKDDVYFASYKIPFSIGGG